MSAPHAEYTSRLSTIAQTTAKHKKHDRFYAAAKLVLGIFTVIAAIWLVRDHRSSLGYLAIPAALFVLLAILHERVLRALRCCSRITAFYQRGLARLEDRWAEAGGENGERFLDPTHPYTRDLDIFGSASLFQLLSSARTRVGEETLAAWLKSAAPIPEIIARQAAVRDLEPRLDFREEIAVAGDEIREGIHPDALIAWAEGKPSFRRRRIFMLAFLLSLLWLLSLVLWWQWGWFTGALAMSAINLGVRYKINKQMEEAAHAIDGAAKDLRLLATLLIHIEEERFTAARLTQLQAALRSGDVIASGSIAQLGKRLNWLDSAHNQFARILDLFLFWTPFCVVALEAWRERYGSSIRQWLTATGEIEALNSLAAYAYEHPADVFPEFVEQGPCFDAEGLAHPLLARDKAVSNDLKLDRDLRMLVISGPNMAGKSTFIRAVGVNAVLAQAGAPVCARRFMLSSLQVAASICILDSLHGGLSRFYAEISRLKQIDDLSRQPMPVLFLLDELLSGTNSHDRRIGTESFVRSLLACGGIGLVTTHDLALAEITARIDAPAANFHFEDRFEGGKLIFDYKLTPGIVQTANALQLMRSIGLEV
jgi:hypothetical protein